MRAVFRGVLLMPLVVLVPTSLMPAETTRFFWGLRRVGVISARVARIRFGNAWYCRLDAGVGQRWGPDRSRARGCAGQDLSERDKLVNAARTPGQ
jgi:hypothetical protein